MSGPAPRVPRGTTDADLLAALQRADEQVRAALLERCDAAGLRSGVPYHDVRPLLEAHEVSAATRDLHQELLRYAFARGIAKVHPHVGHLLHIRATPTTGATTP